MQFLMLHPVTDQSAREMETFFPISAPEGHAGGLPTASQRGTVYQSSF